MVRDHPMQQISSIFGLSSDNMAICLRKMSYHNIVIINQIYHETYVYAIFMIISKYCRLKKYFWNNPEAQSTTLATWPANNLWCSFTQNKTTPRRHFGKGGTCLYLHLFSLYLLVKKSLLFTIVIDEPCKCVSPKYIWLWLIPFLSFFFQHRKTIPLIIG